MKKWFSIALGIVTATGGFLDAGTIATAGESGAKFGLGLIWAVIIATAAIILLVEMVGRFTAVSKKPYAAAIRENFGFRFFLAPLTCEIIAESLMLAAELGGVAIALSLLTGISWHYLFPVAALLVFAMAWRAPFDWIENGPAILGLVTLSLLRASSRWAVCRMIRCRRCGDPRSKAATLLITSIWSRPRWVRQSAPTCCTFIPLERTRKAGRAVLCCSTESRPSWVWASAVWVRLPLSCLELSSCVP